MQKPLILTTVAFATAAAAVGLSGAASGADEPEFTALGVYDSGSGEGGSEIVAVDAKSERMFITNGAATRVDIVDISDANSPSLVGSVDVAGYGDSIQSVAVSKKGVVAAAVAPAAPSLLPGSVVFFDIDGNVDDVVEVGNLPDAIAFTPNGKHLVVANEAEPVCDGATLLGDPEGSISIIDVKKGEVETAGFGDWIGDEDALRAAGVRIFFPGSNAAQDLEPEYVTISKDSKTAYVTLQENNAVAVVDIKKAEVDEIIPLGYQDHNEPGNGLDPSNEDGAEAIANWNVLGMYLPDAIAWAKLGKDEVFITANEGDARDYGDCFNEEIRVKDLRAGEGTTVGGVEAQGLAVPPYAATDTDDERLGRLKTTTAFPTSLNGADQVEQLYSFGTRSFTIFDEDGEVLFDSGDDFEQLLVGTPFFNLDDDETDGRSDDKGPEPEALAVGEVDKRTYAFIGFERSGGVAMYDITEPEQSYFVDYINTAEVAGGVVTGGGDVGPEGISFIEAKQSPTGEAMIAVSFEISGTTRLIEIS